MLGRLNSTLSAANTLTRNDLYLFPNRAALTGDLRFNEARTVIYAPERFDDRQALIHRVMANVQILRDFFAIRHPVYNPDAHEEQDFRRSLRMHARGLNSPEAVVVEHGTNEMDEGTTSDFYRHCYELFQS